MINLLWICELLSIRSQYQCDVLCYSDVLSPNVNRFNKGNVVSTLIQLQTCWQLCGFYSSSTPEPVITVPICYTQNGYSTLVHLWLFWSITPSRSLPSHRIHRLQNGQRPLQSCHIPQMPGHSRHTHLQGPCRYWKKYQYRCHHTLTEDE